MSDENNLTPKKRSVGHPPNWNTPEELQAEIENYLNSTDIDKYTLTGLCIFLNSNKVTLGDYQKKPEFNEIVSQAKQYIEHSYELDCKANGRAGSIFALKNFGWTDKQEIDFSDKTDYKTQASKIDMFRKKYDNE